MSSESAQSELDLKVKLLFEESRKINKEAEEVESQLMKDITHTEQKQMILEHITIHSGASQNRSHIMQSKKLNTQVIWRCANATSCVSTCATSSSALELHLSEQRRAAYQN
jgi:hypothetical protein